MLGYAREELDFHFSTWEELVHPEDLPRALDDLRAYLEGEADTYDPEIRMRTKSGDWRWIQTIGRVVERDEEGTVARLAGIHLDIDERKRAEQALREAKARYQTLIEHFPDGGVFLFDENLEYTIAGGKGLAAAGFSPSDFAGKTPRDLFPTEIAEEQMRCYRHALEGQKKGFEQTFDGRHYRVQTLPIREGNGEVVAGMAVSQDITERKETRQRLERYRAYTDRLLDAVDDLFFVLGEEAQFRRWNERLPEVTGYSDDELAEMTAFDLVPESEHERVAATVGNAFVSGSVQAELPLLRKDGTTFPYEFVGSLVRSPEGELQIVGVGRDITERKRRKEALERKNDLFTRAQDIASVGAWEYDVRAGELTTTDEMSRIFGHSPGTDMTVEQRILSHHPDDQPTIRAALRRAIEEGEPYDLELRLVRDDGTQRWIHSRGEPQLEDGEIVRVRGTIQDITERRRQREALKEAKDAAEEADRIKSALLSNMNHEFRTPLTSIISFSELLSREPDLAETFADRILGGGRRLLHTLNTVMDFAELEAGSVSVTPMRVDVNSLVRSTVDTFSHLVGQDLSVQIHVPTEGLTVSQDEHHLERVLTHLVHNALKFTEEGTIEITARRASDGVAVSVSDPGIGIPPEALPHVFDEFAQASSGSDRTHEGNGIGLTVVKRLVAHMDGTVALDSTPGAGTEVTVRLPNLE
jgi:PAS domain S-box-containing protein